MKDIFEMEWKLLRLEGLDPGFLSIGVTAAVLSGEGTDPEVREALIMLVMGGTGQEWKL